MELVLETGPVTLFKGDCREAMKTLRDNSVDSIVTDPPYELNFMGKGWDNSGIAFDPVVWAQAYRVLKPGGHVLAFGATRLWHRLAVAIEDAGFEIRDSIAWLYGQGFPKSMDVAKAITGMERGHGSNSGAIRRATMGESYEPSGRFGNRDGAGRRDTGLKQHNLELSENGQKWEGWGTALKPAFEPVVVARKPLEGTVATNVLAHGTGALNINASRIATSETWEGRELPNAKDGVTFGGVLNSSSSSSHTLGRFPSNVIFDESQAAALDEQTGTLTSGLMKARTERKPRPGGQIYGADKRNIVAGDTYADSGGASRFFYVAKASSAERPEVDGKQHSTVKPLALMRYLVKLVTPPNGVALDPFAGSGTTLEAAVLEGFDVIGIELDEDGTHIPLIEQRLGKPLTPAMF